MIILFWFFISLGFYLFFFYSFYFRKILATIQFMKNSAKVFKKTVNLSLIYTITFILNLIFSILTFFYIFINFSMGSVETKTNDFIEGKKLLIYKFDNSSYILIFFDLIVLLFFFKLIQSTNKALTLFIVTSWYFKRKKKSSKFQILQNIEQLFLWHFGTLIKFALFSLLFSWIKFFSKKILLFLKKLNQNWNSVRFLIAIFSPLLFLYQNYLKFLDDNLFVQVALWGDDFEKASKKSFYLKFSRNKSFKFLAIKWINKILFSFKILHIFSTALIIYVIIFLIGINKGEFFNFLDFRYISSLFYILSSFFISSSYYDNYIGLLEGVMNNYLMDVEMFVGDQLYYEKIWNDIITLTKTFSEIIEKDKSIFGFNFTKKEMVIQEGKVYAINVHDDESEDEKSQSQKQMKSSGENDLSETSEKSGEILKKGKKVSFNLKEKESGEFELSQNSSQIKNSKRKSDQIKYKKLKNLKSFEDVRIKGAKFL